MSYCTKCGKKNLDTAKFCTGCGGGLTTIAPALHKKKNNQRIIISSIVLLGLLVATYFIFFNKRGEKNNGYSANTQVSEDEVIKLKELVYQWNAGLNNGNSNEIAALYAERLVYYRTQMSKGNAAVLLNDFFLKNPGFLQEITSDITFEKINNNLIVCNFQKTATLNSKKTDYPSYLKASQEMGVWKIVEEGDKITDYNLDKNKKSQK